MPRSGGEPVPLKLNQNDTTRYGYDAARTYWRIALDWRWNSDGRAATYLGLAGFLRDEFNRQGGVAAIYAHDGSVIEATPSLVGDAGALAAFLTLEPSAGYALQTEHLLAAAHRGPTGVSWGDPNDLYAQEWGWFATALYADALPNLWQNQ